MGPVKRGSYELLGWYWLLSLRNTFAYLADNMLGIDRIVHNEANAVAKAGSLQHTVLHCKSSDALRAKIPCCKIHQANQISPPTIASVCLLGYDDFIT